MAKRYNITTPQTYIKDGVEKKAWRQVGKLVYFPASGDKEEGFILELNMFPNTKFGVFPETERDVQPAPEPVEDTTESTYPVDEGLDLSAIPF